MRLLTKLRRLELSRALDDARERAIVPTGVMWTHREGAPVELAEGEELVLDYKILSTGVGYTIADVIERATRDAEDVGKVLDASGAEIGVVTRTEGGVIAYRLYATGGEIACPTAEGAA